MRRRLLLLITLVLLNLLVLEVFTRMIVVHAKPTLGKTNTYDHKYQLAQDDIDTPEVLLLGDSIIDFAIYPELLEVLLAEKKMPIHVRNLASPSANPMMNLLLLKEVVENSGKPRLVVYNFYPRIFNKNDVPDEFDTNFTNTYLWRCHGKEDNNLMEEAACLLEENIALVRYRSFLRGEFEKLPKTLFRFDQRIENEVQGSIDTEVSPKGWAPAYDVHSAASFNQEYKHNTEVIEMQNKELGNFEWTEARFDPFLNYCKSQGIPVLLVWLPEHDLMEKYYRYQNLSHDEIAGYIRKMVERENIYFADMEHLELDDVQYADLDHANPLGAIEITHKMAQILQAPVYRKLIQPQAVTARKP